MDQAGWGITATATNATATATKAAVAGKQFILYGFSASFSAAPAAPVLMQILDGVTVIFEGYVSAPVNHQFVRGLAITNGSALSATLLAGGGGILGKINLHGVTH